MAYKVAIDNGHGLNTPGKRTPPFPNTGKVIHEWEFNYPTAKKLNVELQRCGFKTIMVSDTSKDTPLRTRTDRANKAKADVFVSIHYNAFQGKWGTHGGVDTFHHPSSTKGKKLAAYVQKELVPATGLRDRGAQAYNFFVCRETNMPAILCECGFMDNLEEAKLMLNEGYQQRVAEAIAKGICAYLGVKYVPKAEPKPEPKPEPISNILYRVQTGAFKVKANADTLLAKVKKAGFDTYMVQDTKGLYKVQVGAYSIKANADVMAKQLRAKGFDTYITTEAGKAPTEPKPTPQPKPQPKQTWENYVNGSIVKKLQTELNKQFKANLKVDGYLGNATIAALVVIRQGARGRLTNILQTRLRTLGYLSGIFSVDSIFGVITYNAVKKFQRDRRLAVDGVVGIETWKALFRK
ncbi:MAG TPA: N-acetylmuramoyl-L-alanine amidase [Bacillota bacterium]|nr:N-acetylmuramoyl-L-alanine amidase [Bacillota bacterium]